MKDDDLLLQALAGLPPVAPDVEWETCVRERCHAALSRRSMRARSFVDLAACAAMCLYLAAVFLEAARLAGVF